MQRSSGKFAVIRITALLGAVALFFTGMAAADTLRVTPDQLKLSSADPVTKLVLTNTSSEEKFLNFDVGLWQQEDDREWVTPTTKLIVVPQRMTLEPGASGEVHVVLRLAASWWQEEAFQLMVTETSLVPDMGDDLGYSYDDRTTWPSSVPVFLMPAGKAVPRVTWSLERSEAGDVFLQARNSGRGHVRLYTASLLGPTGQTVEKINLSDVILPGGIRTWEFPTIAMPGFWQLVADTNAGQVQIDLEMEYGDFSGASLSYSQ